ncbi:MAG: CHAT domain-containing protein, partial [Bacteroidetes bacterium]|nr:CHAT domain-containing protein [Bacteroidota bacterium]
FSGVLFLQKTNYDSALICFKSASDFYYQQKQWELFLRSELKISQIFLNFGKYDSAYKSLKSLGEVIFVHKISSKKLIAEFYYLKGNLSSKLNAADSSNKFFGLSLEYCEDSSYDSLLVMVYKSLGNQKLKENNYNSALDYFKKAIALEKTRNNSSNTTISSLVLNVGIVYSNLGIYDSASLCFDSSLKMKEKFLKINDPQLASGYLNYGRFLQIMGESLKALDFLSRAEEIYLASFGGDYSGLAPIYFNKGSIYVVLGEYNQALTYHERALELYRKNTTAPNPIREMNLNFGVIYEKLGNTEKALEYYEKCQAEDSSPENRIKSLRNSARCFSFLENYTKAEENYRKAILISENSFGRESYHAAGSYKAYGSFCSMTMKYKEASTSFHKALRYYQDLFGNKNKEVSLVLVNLADLFFETSEIDKSLEMYQQALISAIQDYNDPNFNSNPVIAQIEPEFNNFVILYKKTVALHEKYNLISHQISDLKASYETNILAIALFEKIISSYKDENTKLLINELVYDVYNSMILTATELYQETNQFEFLKSAFEYSEKGKGAVLLSTLRHSEALAIGNIPNSIKELEQQLSQEISLFKNNLYDENQKIFSDTNKIRNLKKMIFETSLRYDSLIKHLEKDYPEYYQLKYSFKVSDITDVQNRLNPSEAFIEFKSIDSVLISFYITKDTILLSKKILEADLNRTVMSFIKFINTFPGSDFNSHSFKEFITTSNYLYKILLGQFDGLDRYKNLLIVPDGIIGYLNFEALLMNNFIPDKIDFKKLQFAIQQYSFTYLYSATIMGEKLVIGKNNNKVLAMAPTYLTIDKLSKRVDQLSRDKVNLLRPLDYSIEEVSNIASSINGEVITGEDATEKAFKSQAHKYCILHFAMHTLIDDEDPLNSKMVFTLNNDLDEDGFLNNYEIYNLKLSANLAVLSACKTGTGKLSQGEGIMSLARGFMYAGVPAIIMTLWEIEDISSADIMNKFYQNLKKGNNIGEALRNSKIEYLTEADQLHTHPYFWAAYVQIGNNSFVITNSRNGYFTYLVSILVLLFAVFVVWTKYRKNKNIS